MRSSVSHWPFVRGTPTSTRRCGFPPDASTRYNVRPTKNAMERLSGDHIGKLAPSVPGSTMTSAESRRRTRNVLVPVLSAMMTATA